MPPCSVVCRGTLLPVHSKRLQRTALPIFSSACSSRVCTLSWPHGCASSGPLLPASVLVSVEQESFEWKVLLWAPLQVQCHSCPLVQPQESSDVFSLELALCVDGVQGILDPLREVLVRFPGASPKVSHTPAAATFPALQFTVQADPNALARPAMCTVWSLSNPSCLYKALFPA